MLKLSWEQKERQPERSIQSGKDCRPEMDAQSERGRRPGRNGLSGRSAWENRKNNWQQILRQSRFFCGMSDEKWEEMKKEGKLALCLLFLLSMFFAGRTVGYVQQAVEAASRYGAVVMEEENWGLGFGEKGTQPSGNTSAEELAKYDAYYIGSADEKKIYLTFDCGYENGNTEAILDALKKHDVKATFFVVGHFLESAPELVKRMTEEGHTVGNHTYHHPDMASISSREKFQEEMDGVAKAYKELTGLEIAPYYRPPQGKYSRENLQMAKELGYHTFFWSLAYVDWNVDSQPSHEEALQKLTDRIHPGAVVLLHNTSKTNGEILDELLGKWEEMGYSFGVLADLCGE